jgi:hypothetical protein
MSDTSILTETIPDALLDEREVYQVKVVDGDAITHRYEIATEITNPWEFDAERFLPNTTPMSLPRFFEIAANIISDAQDRDGVIADKKVSLVEEYPPDRISDFGDELICYRLLKREPANMNTKATGRPQRKSMYAYDVRTSTHPNKTIVVESRPIDHLIEFSCWAKSNKLANSRALWLEKLFVNHAWAFEVQGVERFHWKNRGPDTYMTSGGQRLLYRPVNFFVRFREFELKASPLLRTIEFEIGADKTNSEINNKFK